MLFIVDAQLPPALSSRVIGNDGVGLVRLGSKRIVGNCRSMGFVSTHSTHSKIQRLAGRCPKAAEAFNGVRGQHRAGLAISIRFDDLDGMARTPTPDTDAAEILGRGVLGVTRDGVRILRQRPSEHFTQKQAREAVRKVLAARQAG